MAGGITMYESQRSDIAWILLISAMAIAGAFLGLVAIAGQLG